MTNDLSGAPQPTELERKRFMALTMMRVMGLGLIVLGVLVAGGKIDLPVLIGYVLVLIGMFDCFIMPKLLARRWRTPGE